MQTKPYNLQAPEDIAKEYGGNKQKIAKAAQMGLLDPTAAVLAGMFIDRMRGAQAQEQVPQQTVAQQTFAPPAPAQMQSPQRALGATPQAPQMAAMQQQMAPRRGARGMDRIPTNPNMMPSAAGGGLVAFAEGGRPMARSELVRRRQQLQQALSGNMPQNARRAVQLELAEVENQLAGQIQSPLADSDISPYGMSIESIGPVDTSFPFLSSRNVPKTVREDVSAAADAVKRGFDAGVETIKDVGSAIDRTVIDPARRSGSDIVYMLGGETETPYSGLEEAFGGDELTGGEMVKRRQNREELMALEEAFGGDARVAADRQGASQNVSQSAGQNLSAATPRDNTAVTTPTETYTESGARGLMATNAGQNTGFKVMPTANQTTDQTTEPEPEDPYKEVKAILSRDPNSSKKGVFEDAIKQQTTPKSAVEKAQEAMDKKKESGDSYMPDFMKTSAEDLDSDTTLEGTATDIDAIASSGLGEEEQAALDYYKQAETRAKDAQRKNAAMFLIEIGAGMAAGESPYALQNIGKAVKSALPQYRAGMEASKKEVQAAMDKRASFDVIKNKRQIQNLTLALDKYKGDTANDIRKKITALEQNNKVLLASMDIDARKEMQILNLITTKEEKQADRDHTSRENEANRYHQERLKAFDIYSRATEGKLQREHEFSLAEKQNTYASARLQIEQMFKGEQNRLQRENALKAVEMQVNAPTNESRQLKRFADYIREQNPDMSDAQVNDLAQRAVFDAQAAVVNAAKFDAIAYDVYNNAYKNAADSWDNMPVKPKGMKRDEFIRKEIDLQIRMIREQTNVLGNRFSSGKPQETDFTDLYENK